MLFRLRQQAHLSTCLQVLHAELTPLGMLHPGSHHCIHLPTQQPAQRGRVRKTCRVLCQIFSQHRASKVKRSFASSILASGTASSGILHLFRHLTCAVETLAEGAGQIVEFVQLGVAANDCQSVPPLVQGTFLDQPYNMYMVKFCALSSMGGQHTAVNCPEGNL